MQNPGSNPDIPVEAEVAFEEQWDRTRPGVKRKIAYLELANERRLVVFPHREWNAPILERRRVVLFPVRNAAVAAPVGGISESERLTASIAPPEASREPAIVAPISPGQRDAYGRIAELLEPIDRAYSKIDEGMEQLNEALDRLAELARQLRPSVDGVEPSHKVG
ncbi:MAG: hypothetical protein HY678_04700 [Chloroflexi bacterium]|nr:hypothetical protein [Chloroflexota bacterium]